MKKNLYLLFFVSVFVINAKAQVTIGSQDAPTPGAVLELKSTKLGFLPPRVTLTRLSDPSPLPNHVEGMVVYNTKVSASDTLQAGLYYNSGKRWVLLSMAPSFTQSWFYMPSIPIDVVAPKEIDLYQEFETQLNTAGGLVTGSDGAPTPVLADIPGRNNLYYYVTAYDNTVFENIKISADGKMTYGIKSGAIASDGTYINIVFVEKPVK